MSLFPKNKNSKLYLLLAICLIVILAMWLYTLKLNLSREAKSGLGFKEIFGDLGSMLNDLPKFPGEMNTSTLTMTDGLIKKVGEKLKDLEIEKQRNKEIEQCIENLYQAGKLGSDQLQLNMMQRDREDEMNITFRTERELTVQELDILSKLGIIVYTQSYTPSFENHPFGSYLARSKVEVICRFIDLDFVKSIDSAEMANYPQ